MLFRSVTAWPDLVVDEQGDPVSGRGTLPAEFRKALGGLLTGPGVLPGGSDPLVQGTAGFAYQVNAATWATPGGSGGGLHLWGNDGPMTVSDVLWPPEREGESLAAPAAGLSRIDIIYAVHPSKGENGDTDSEPVVAVAKGTPASSPVDPSLPPRAIELGRNTMTSAATSTTGPGNSIQQSAPRILVGGGLYPYRRLRASMVLPNLATTVLQWTSNDVGEATPGLGYSNGVLTVAAGAGGLYTIGASVGWTAGSTTDGYIRVTIDVNGAPVGAGSVEKGSSKAAYLIANASVAAIRLKAGDTVRVRAVHNIGEPQTTELDYTHWQIARVL